MVLLSPWHLFFWVVLAAVYFAHVAVAGHVSSPVPLTQGSRDFASLPVLHPFATAQLCRERVGNNTALADRCCTAEELSATLGPKCLAFKDGNNQTSLGCLAGYFSADIPGGSVEACPPGFYCPAYFTCIVPCSQGAYCPDSRVVTPDADHDISMAFAACARTLNGKYCANQGRCCQHYCLPPAHLDGQQVCPGAASDSPCPAGYTCQTTALAEICPVGQYCPAGFLRPRSCLDFFGLLQCAGSGNDKNHWNLLVTVVIIMVLCALGIFLSLLAWWWWRTCHHGHSDLAKSAEKERCAAVVKFLKAAGLKTRPVAWLILSPILMLSGMAWALWVLLKRITCDKKAAYTDTLGNNVEPPIGALGINLKKLKRNRKPELQLPLEMKIEPKSKVAIMGPSGAGKSSLMHLIRGNMGYAKPSGSMMQTAEAFEGWWLDYGYEGNISFYFKNSTGVFEPNKLLLSRNMANLRADYVSYVPQEDKENLRLELTLLQMWQHQLRLLQQPAGSLNDDEICMQVGKALFPSNKWESVKNTLCLNLSGGERKRASVGLELLRRPSLILLDEPTSGLDATTSLTLLEAIDSVQSALKFETTVIAVIHSPPIEVLAKFDKLLLLSTITNSNAEKTSTAAAAGVVYFGDILPQENLVMRVQNAMPHEWSGASETFKFKFKGIPERVSELAEGAREWSSIASAQPHSPQLQACNWATAEPQKTSDVEPAPKDVDVPRKTADYVTQLLAFLRLNSTISLRRWVDIYVVYNVLVVCAGAIIGSLFIDLQYKHYPSTLVFAGFAMLFYCMIAALGVLSLNRNVLFRESRGGSFVAAQCLGAFIVESPIILLQPLLFLVPFYCFGVLFVPFGHLYAAFLTLCWAGSGIAHVMGTVMTQDTAKMMTILVVFAAAMISGGVQPLESLPTFLRQISVLSPLRWFIEGIWAELYADQEVLQKSVYCLGKSYGYKQGEQAFGYAMYYLVLIGVVSRFLAFLLLLFSHRLERTQPPLIIIAREHALEIFFMSLLGIGLLMGLAGMKYSNVGTDIFGDVNVPCF